MTGTRTTSSPSFSLSFYQYHSSSFFPRLAKKVQEGFSNGAEFSFSRDNISARRNKGYLDKVGRTQIESGNPDSIIAGTYAAISVPTTPMISQETVKRNTSKRGEC